MQIGWDEISEFLLALGAQFEFDLILFCEMQFAYRITMFRSVGCRILVAEIIVPFERKSEVFDCCLKFF